MSALADSTLCALDVGDKRIGVAQANAISLLPQPCAVIPNDGDVVNRVKALLSKYNARALVVGLPRSLAGEETQQTRIVREFVEIIRPSLDIPLFFQDEAGTSKKAEQELLHRPKKHGSEPRDSVDALAATYILDDFIQEGKHYELFN